MHTYNNNNNNNTSKNDNESKIKAQANAQQTYPQPNRHRSCTELVAARFSPFELSGTCYDAITTTRVSRVHNRALKNKFIRRCRQVDLGM